MYRLIVKPDNTVQVEIDQNVLYSGKMKDDWELLKPKVISDPKQEAQRLSGDPFVFIKIAQNVCDVHTCVFCVIHSDVDGHNC